MGVKVKYREGDIFVIALSTGMYAMCKLVFAPKGKFKQIISFCVLSIQHDEVFSNDGNLTPLSVEKFGKKTKVIFTGNQNISNGLWKVISHADLTEEELNLRVFNYAGGVYNGEVEVCRIAVSEYDNYTTMGVSGFGLVDKILTSI